MLKKIIWSLSIILVLIILIILSVIAPIDFAPLDQQPAIHQTFSRIENTNFVSSHGNEGMQAGWASTNITPENPIQMAGYGPRGPYISILDS
ncbi:hypothetical protein IIC68_03930, partial [archaeon]|nr:hypothetical protein [archaeon]